MGKLQSMAWYWRLTLLVIIAGLFYSGFWYFVTKGTRQETDVLNKEIAVLLQKNAQAQVASQRLNEFKAILKARQEEYDELKALLPEQREITMVLEGLQERAHGNGLVLRRFTPREEVLQDNYSGKKIDVNVTSSFASLRAFFEQLAHYQRIVSVTNFELKQLDSQSNHTVDARFDLTAYYVSAEKLQKQANPPAPAPPAQTGTAPPAQPAK